jgi:hypothetical protein
VTEGPEPCRQANIEILVELQPHYFVPTAAGMTRSRVSSAA